MADIEYRIDYDEAGLITSQHILEIGTKDRVRFVTTPKTVDYLAKKRWKLAIQRNPVSENPFKEGLHDQPYLVPVDSAEHWIVVEHKGKNFHWDCGYLDEHDKFHKWPEQPPQPPQPRTHLLPKDLQARQVNSLPFPI